MSRNASGPHAFFIACAAVLFIGVAMADTHDPVAIDPKDAAKDGAEVATFALG